MRTPTPALRRLLTEGSLPLSAVSGALLRWLAPMLATGVVERLRSGVGERLIVRRAETLAAHVNRCFPGGVGDASADSRSVAVIRFRDSKVGAVDAPTLVLLRGLPGALLESPDERIDLAKATADHGAFALAVDDLQRFRLSGSVAVVENREAFFAAERLRVQGLPARSYVLGNGRLSLRLRDWLAAQTVSLPSIDLWHCGDYDAAGLCDYLALRAAGATVRLFVPADLDGLLRRFGKPSLVIGNAELEGLRRRLPDRDVDAVYALLQAHGCGLEQEVLLDSAAPRIDPQPR